ncbi:hypothetical protein LCGC14_2305740, partial [marine sediment metagenome]
MKLSNIKIILRDFIYDFNDKFSNLGKPIFAMWNIFHKIKFTTKKIIKEGIEHLNFGSDKLSDATVLWINPQKIDFFLTNKFVKSSEFSMELKGNWDLTKKLIKDSIIYGVLKSRFLETKKDEEIKQFKNDIFNREKDIELLKEELKKERNKTYEQIKNYTTLELQSSKALIAVEIISQIK